MKRPFRTLPALALALAITGPSPRTQADPGVRVGLTDDPDSLFVGFFLEEPLSYGRSAIFAIEPGADVGFGRDVDYFTIRGTLNGKVLFPVGRSAYLYPIFGLSLYYINFDDCNGCDDTSVGGNLGLGFRIDRFNFELTFGIDDAAFYPDITFNFGFLL
jgi:hypothetical protein